MAVTVPRLAGILLRLRIFIIVDKDSDFPVEIPPVPVYRQRRIGFDVQYPIRPGNDQPAQHPKGKPQPIQKIQAREARTPLHRADAPNTVSLKLKPGTFPGKHGVKRYPVPLPAGVPQQIPKRRIELNRVGADDSDFPHLISPFNARHSFSTAAGLISSKHGGGFPNPHSCRKHTSQGTDERSTR